MASETSKNDARLNFRLPTEIKQTIEEAAACLGQTVSDFAISTLAQNARQVIQDHQITRLSRRDRDRFTALLDDISVDPNAALIRAAQRYEERG